QAPAKCGVDYRSSKKSSCPAGQPDSEHSDRRGERMSAALQLGQSAGLAAACRALGVPRASLYRMLYLSLQPAATPRVRPTSARALDPQERQTVLDHLHSKRFCDKAPMEVYATLLDEGIYLCSVRSMHRILAENGEMKERRNQLRHPRYKKPELLATAPIKSGAGTSQSYSARPSGRTSISTSSWTSSAATWSAGWWPGAKPRSWPNG